MNFAGSSSFLSYVKLERLFKFLFTYSWIFYDEKCFKLFVFLFLVTETILVEEQVNWYIN